MNINRLITLLGILVLFLAALPSCGNKTNNCAKTAIEDNEISTNSNDSIQISIFGIKTLRDECSVAKSLEKADIIKVDTILMDNGKFQSAIVEFAGIEFGMNKGFIFVTSRHDKEAINLLVSKISDFYGEPEIEEEQADPEYRYYHWNLYKNESDAPYIRIRPIHSEEGGLYMMWDIYQ